VLADGVDALRFVKNGELVAFPERDGAVRLHRVVMLDGNAELALDFHRRVPHRFFGIAARL
jgi:hypothetical protein